MQMTWHWTGNDPLSELMISQVTEVYIDLGLQYVKSVYMFSSSVTPVRTQLVNMANYEHKKCHMLLYL